MSALLVNEPAERAVIAALMRRDDAARLLIDHEITPDLFAPPRTAAYEEIRTSLLQGTQPDAATLRESIDDHTLIEVETSLQESVSDANFEAHVRILKGCRRQRDIADAKVRMKAAVDADAPGDELASIVQTLSDLKANKPTLPAWTPLTRESLRNARLTPRCIVENYLFADLGLFTAAGGTGKTTLLLYEAVCIAIKHDLYGLRVLNPGRTLIVTAEDPEEIFLARLHRIIEAMGLSDYETNLVLSRINILDVCARPHDLAKLDKAGNIVGTSFTSDLIASYQDADLAQIIFDPAVSFGPGERFVNDAEQAIVGQARIIIRGLGCAVRFVQHTGKANSRNNATDQYAGRNGSAFPDGARMVAVLTPYIERETKGAPSGLIQSPTDSGLLLSRPKLSHAPPNQPPIWIRRSGYAYEHIDAPPADAQDDADARLAADADRLHAYLLSEIKQDRRHTRRAVIDARPGGFTQAKVRAALARLESERRIDERDLPEVERQGGRKAYIHPIEAAPTDSDSVKSVEAAGRPTDPRSTDSSSTDSPIEERGVESVEFNPHPSPSTTDSDSVKSVANQLNQFNPSPLSRRILERLASPAGVPDDELKRGLKNGKGTTPAMIDAELERLAAAGKIARVIGRWVRTGGLEEGVRP